MPKYEPKEEKFEQERPVSTDNSSIGLAEAPSLSGESSVSLQQQINELRNMITQFQKASGIQLPKKKLCIVQSRSRLTVILAYVPYILRLDGRMLTTT